MHAQTTKQAVGASNCRLPMLPSLTDGFCLGYSAGRLRDNIHRVLTAATLTSRMPVT